MSRPLDSIVQRLTRHMGTRHIPISNCTPDQANAWTELFQHLEARKLVTSEKPRHSERAAAKALKS